MSFGQELRSQTAAVRLRHEKLGVRKALSPNQRSAAAEVFQADSQALSASKLLLNTRHDAMRKVSGIRSAATAYWKNQTVSYPEPGIRLIRRGKIETFNSAMIRFRDELQCAVAALEAVYGELRESAKANLGTLFNASDYAERLSDEFSLAWEYPAIEPPAYLKELNPALYEQEQQRIAARFEEAVRLTEEALATELSELVGHLADQLTGTVDGKPKTVTKSAVSNIKDFFTRFGELGIRSNDQLEKLAEQAKQLVDGVDVKDVRKDQSFRADLAEKIAEVRAAVDGMVIVKKRAIILEDEEESA